jgi:hypothetical protein
MLDKIILTLVMIELFLLISIMFTDEEYSKLSEMLFKIFFILMGVIGIVLFGLFIWLIWTN